MGNRKNVYRLDKEKTKELEGLCKLLRSNSRTEDPETNIKFWDMDDFKKYCIEKRKPAIPSPHRVFGRLLVTLETAYYNWYGE